MGAPTASREEEIDQLLAENAELRKLLSDVRADLVARAEMDPDDGGAVLNISNGLLIRIDETLKAR